MSDSLITIATYEKAFDAEIAKGRLESEGIVSFIQDSHMVNVNWMMSGALGGAKLLVRKPDAEKAAEILGVTYQDTENDAWGTCPKCGSKDLEPKFDKRASNLTWLLLGIPFLFPRKSFVCKTCGELFKNPKT